MPRQVAFGVVPTVSAGDPAATLEHFTAYLSEVMSTSVVGVRVASYSELVDQLQRDRVQFAWMSPLLYVLAQERMSIQPLVCAVRDDRLDFRSVFFVNADSPLHALTDLAGKRVAWVDPASAAGYLYPRLHIAAAGHDPDRFFADEQFMRSHGEVVRAVFDGRADVGATYAVQPAAGAPISRAGFVEVDPKHQARVIAWTTTIPNDVVVAHGLLPREVQDAFGRALLECGDSSVGRSLLHGLFQADRFATFTSDLIVPVQRLVNVARTNGYYPLL